MILVPPSCQHKGNSSSVPRPSAILPTVSGVGGWDLSRAIGGPWGALTKTRGRGKGSGTRGAPEAKPRAAGTQTKLGRGILRRPQRTVLRQPVICCCDFRFLFSSPCSGAATLSRLFVVKASTSTCAPDGRCTGRLGRRADCISKRGCRRCATWEAPLRPEYGPAG